jgi:hypothetical protein
LAGANGSSGESTAAEIQMSFGKQGGGGRRTNNRKEANLLALVKTRVGSQSADLIDISTTGAQLSGANLPRIGEELFVTFEQVEVFAEVVRSSGETIGIAFDTPISAFQLSVLQAEAKKGKLMKLSPAEKHALDEWKAGRIS